MKNNHAYPGADDITRVVLPNGITVLSRANPYSAAVSIIGYLPVGSILDPQEKSGLAYYTAAALTRGTQQHSFRQIFEMIESCGATLSFNSRTHSTGFSARSLNEDMPLMLRLICESLKEPVFPQDQIEQLRTQFLTGHTLRLQDTGDMADITFDQALFNNHPYARSDDGTLASIRHISRDDLVDFQQRYYAPKGMVLSIVGGIDPQKAVEEVQRAFCDWDKDVADMPEANDYPPVLLPEETKRVHYEIPQKVQMDTIIGTLGPTRRASDYYAVRLGNCILGQFGMMGRIGKTVRDDHGLAYYAGSDLSTDQLCGTWEITAGTNPENQQQAESLIIRELERFVREPVSAEELSDVKSFYIGQLPLSLESNAGVGSALLMIERHQLDLDYYRKYSDIISAVNADEILQAAAHYIDPQRLVISTAGTRTK